MSPVRAQEPLDRCPRLRAPGAWNVRFGSSIGYGAKTSVTVRGSAVEDEVARVRLRKRE
jgi:hypothetical protein